MNILRSVLLDQGGNSINITGKNIGYVVEELIELMMEEFERDYRKYKSSNGLYELPKLNSGLILCLERQKNRIKDIVDEEDFSKVLGLKNKCVNKK